MGGYHFLVYRKKIFDAAAFYFARDIFPPHRRYYIFMIFYSDAGGHLDL